MDTYKDAIVPRSTNTFVAQVIEFNARVLGIQPRPIGLLDMKELEYANRAMHEEAAEFLEAHRQQDVIGAVDAIIDELYFCIGFLYRMGLTEQQISDCMTAVHEANMEKKLGVVEKRGGEGVADAVKPATWVGPEERIATVLGG